MRSSLFVEQKEGFAFVASCLRARQSGGVQAVYLNKARMRVCVYARTRVIARGGVRGRARALPGSIRNPYGFRFKPIRVSFQTRTGFKQTLYGSSKKTH